MIGTRRLRRLSRGSARAALLAALIAAPLPGAAAFPGLAGLVAYQSPIKGGAIDIFTVRADGSDARRLTRTATVCELQPTWSPDGTRIAFERQTSGLDEREAADANLVEHPLAERVDGGALLVRERSHVPLDRPRDRAPPGGAVEVVDDEALTEHVGDLTPKAVECRQLVAAQQDEEVHA